MSAPDEPATARRPIWKRRSVVYPALLLILMVLDAAIGTGLSITPLEALIYLGAGWIIFLKRTISAMHANADLIATSVLCVGILLYGTHRLPKTLTCLGSTGRSWQWRWTWCGLAALALLFLVGMSIGGVAHQIGWIARSDEPLIIANQPVPRIAEMRKVYYSLEETAEKAIPADKQPGRSRPTVAEVRAYIFSPSNRRLWTPAGDGGEYARNLLEAYQILLVVEPDDGTVSGYIYFPRRLEWRRGLYASRIIDSIWKPLRDAEFQATLEEMRPKLLSL